jgi:hypothetical protein
MNQFLIFVLALTLAAGAAVATTVHATPFVANYTDYSGATW